MLNIPQEKNADINERYITNRNTFISKEKEFETEIGDIKQDDFIPQIKIKRWDNECNFSARLIDNTPDQPTIELHGKKIKYKKEKLEVDFYDINGFKENEGAFEFDITLKEKPASNKIEFSIQTKKLKFYYQPELTQAEKDAGYKRPENVIGSIAVYHESKKDYIIGQINYKAGKAFHIYRPKIFDKNGNWVWGELNIDVQAGKMTVIIPQDFLDNAVYPIRHASGATFGYESIGGSSGFKGGDNMMGSLFTSGGSGGTVDSITFYSRYLISSGNAKGVMVNSSHNIISNGVGNAIALPSSAGWTTSTYSTPPTISASTDYVISFIGQNDYFYFYYDTGSANQGHWDSSNSYSSPANPTDYQHTTDKISIYATYTVGGTAHEKNLSDSITLVDSIIKTVNKSLSETLEIVDSLKNATAKTLTEVVTITGSITKKTSKAFSETINLVDSIIKNITRIFTETISLSAIFNSIKTFFRTFTETITITANSVVRIATVVGKAILSTITNKNILSLKSIKRAILRTSKKDKNVLNLKNKDKSIL